ncbi:methylated-DNA--[protein]-cysteine S-methyltransferase [Testudinibacter sp. TR-2022]|uniref:methylated-DNA--[protein]-cysteine S-methyltransferase n=1 Tax=Testudinibacter sp. TR-2022 TaxID=2585029 RepID=UPI0011182CBE|nr:methylated-DNA--[protein]-cysteine S-methyltransferase [Testudinibacter sp. TR-2022]TNH06375.1 methylated-DNA--[protein]-cysteine S-methyltransferase [Pasteurellaceae bacterium Phil11]TNH20782.1 methylated-DNA--[protein]-cysteine S-methyltransferase [Testudinibacter sp. TR-2022]TNH25105.1 methylated-DNA--[protein]-cysteine S-methyltransferase [Testudinibacter sp. TR-2022]
MTNTNTIYYCFHPSPVGKLLLLVKNNALIGIEFEKEQHPIQAAWQQSDTQPVLLATKMALDRYFNGEKEHFSNIPLAPQGTPFQQQVWQALLAIPYGQFSSYSALAQQIGNPKAVRAVGGAVGRNPISIIIPCHRILAKNSALTGFGGGLPAKRYLLQQENIAYLDRGIEYVKEKQQRY